MLPPRVHFTGNWIGDTGSILSSSLALEPQCSSQVVGILTSPLKRTCDLIKSPHIFSGRAEAHRGLELDINRIQTRRQASTVNVSFPQQDSGEHLVIYLFSFPEDQGYCLTQLKGTDAGAFDKACGEDGGSQLGPALSVGFVLSVALLVQLDLDNSVGLASVPGKQVGAVTGHKPPAPLELAPDGCRGPAAPPLCGHAGSPCR